MSVRIEAAAPSGLRRVPLLEESELDHYPEFSRFFAERFGLGADPWAPPAVLAIGERFYELVFVGRSGRVFPCGIEVSALVPGLEPLDLGAADADLFELLGWVLDGVGPPWRADALRRSAAIFRVPWPGAD